MAVDQHTGDVDRVHAVADQIARFNQSERDRFARLMVREMGSDLFKPAEEAYGGAVRLAGQYAPSLRQAGEYDEAPSKQPHTIAQPLGLDNVEDAFTYKPWNHDQNTRGDQVREALLPAARAVLRHVPYGPLRTRALNCLIDCRMLANAAITFGGRF